LTFINSGKYECQKDPIYILSLPNKDEARKDPAEPAATPAAKPAAKHAAKQYEDRSEFSRFTFVANTDDTSSHSLTPKASLESQREASAIAAQRVVRGWLARVRLSKLRAEAKAVARAEAEAVARAEAEAVAASEIEEQMVFAAQQKTADPLPIKAGDWQGVPVPAVHEPLPLPVREEHDDVEMAEAVEPAPPRPTPIAAAPAALALPPSLPVVAVIQPEAEDVEMADAEEGAEEPAHHPLAVLPLLMIWKFMSGVVKYILSTEPVENLPGTPTYVPGSPDGVTPDKTQTSAIDLMAETLVRARNTDDPNVRLVPARVKVPAFDDHPQREKRGVKGIVIKKGEKGTPFAKQQQHFKQSLVRCVSRVLCHCRDNACV
jgi:hypothetical protein